ncbi:DMT family transporter [Phenylobacterium immobile]|uniref:DMT family transporter n=1 Tax=Phenylobacterium immobile TaxID=21 RepID=UPI000B00FFCC|nr:DMT family transporter [Phenylobacterium immobile]
MTATQPTTLRGYFATLSPNAQGALWVMASAAAYTLMTTLVKYLGEGYPPPVQIFYRQVAGFLVLLPYIFKHRAAAYSTTRPVMLTFRSLAATSALVLSFYSFQNMPLADANALSFTRTLWIVPLAFFLLREKIGPVRLGAALLGFVGVLVMVRPGSSGGFVFGLPVLAALASALLFAFTTTGTKVMTRETSPTTLLVWSATLGLVLSIPGAILMWRWPAPVDLALLFTMGAVATLNQFCFVNGMKVGDAAAMAPIDYIRLVFAAAVGFFLFDETPTIWTALGAAIVVASTLFITWREIAGARKARVEAPAPA